jgi:hypothetical protein
MAKVRAMTTRGAASPILLAVLLLALTGCGTPAPPVERLPERQVGQWERLPDAPLSPRRGAAAFWLDGEVHVVGGTTHRPCPPGASCGRPPDAPTSGALLRDGAAYEPVSGAWRMIAEAPVDLLVRSGVVLGGRLYVLTDEAFAAYDAAEDRWETLPSPPGGHAASRLVATDEALVLVHGSQERGMRPDVAFDPTSHEWHELPPDPLAPSFDRHAVWTGSELVLLGAAHVPNPGSAAPSLVRAAAYVPAHGTWRRLPDSGVLSGGVRWDSVGGQVVSTALGGADGGTSNNYGRTYPYGGVLDAAAERWSPLPSPPPSPGPLAWVTAAGPETVVREGWALHVPSATWTAVPEHEGLPDEEGAAVWAGDRLFVWGGVRWIDPDPFSAEAVLLADGWSWRP